jgi:hypothetical protein
MGDRFMRIYKNFISLFRNIGRRKRGKKRRLEKIQDTKSDVCLGPIT